MACASVAGAAVCAVSFNAPSAAVPSSSSSLFGSSSGARFHVSSAPPSVRPVAKRLCKIVAMSSPPKPQGLFDELVEKVKASISSAQEVCFGNENSEECVVAWDEVEELSAAAAHKRVSSSPSGHKDPLEKYCEDNPETDECRVYED